MFQTIAEELIEKGRAEGRAETQTIAEELIEKGRAEARAEAQAIAEELIERGRAEGRTEGELQTHRHNLRHLLLRKFRQLPDEVLQRLEACSDVERFKIALERVLDWQSVDEFDL